MPFIIQFLKFFSQISPDIILLFMDALVMEVNGGDVINMHVMISSCKKNMQIYRCLHTKFDS